MNQKNRKDKILEVLNEFGADQKSKKEEIFEIVKELGVATTADVHKRYPNTTKGYIKLALNRLANEGRLRRVKRGVFEYAGEDPVKASRKQSLSRARTRETYQENASRRGDVKQEPKIGKMRIILGGGEAVVEFEDVKLEEALKILDHALRKWKEVATSRVGANFKG